MHLFPASLIAIQVNLALLYVHIHKTRSLKIWVMKAVIPVFIGTKIPINCFHPISLHSTTTSSEMSSAYQTGTKSKKSESTK